MSAPQPPPPLPAGVLFEACIDSVASALAAIAGGAGRLELCEALVEGGLTPSLGKVEGVVRAAAASGTPVHVLVRPRSGDFCYSEAEFETMLRDVALCGGAGAAGVVVGALAPDGRVDAARLRALVAAARRHGGMRVTLHRAVDAARDAVEAALAGAAAGVDFVLTSGGARSAEEGAAVIAAMGEALRCAAASAGGGAPAPTLIAAAGVTAANAAAIVRAAGVRQLHGTARAPGYVPGAMEFLKSPPIYMGGERANSPEAEAGQRVATAESVGAIVAQLRGL
jgi:copper homeostasis protein